MSKISFVIAAAAVVSLAIVLPVWFALLEERKRELEEELCGDEDIVDDEDDFSEYEDEFDAVNTDSWYRDE